MRIQHHLPLGFAPRTARRAQPQAPLRDVFRAGPAATAGRELQALARMRPLVAAGLPPAVLAAQLEVLLQQALSDPATEKQLLDKLAQLNASGELKPVLHQFAEQATASGAIPPMPEGKRKAMVEQLAGMIDAEFQAHGMTPDTQGQTYKTWEQLAAENLAAVRNTQVPARGPGMPSCFTDPTFVAEMEAVQGARFVGGNRMTALIDGPASFAVRDRLIAGAQSSIRLMSWAFYDDTTGWDTARKLVEKQRQGVAVQVVVDGQVGSRPGNNETLDFLEANGVEVIRWRDPKRPYDGQHRKLMVVDGQSAVVGGINQGDVYSHRGEGPKWRDTDILLEGPAVNDCEQLFARIAGRPAPAPASLAATGSARTAVVDHVPGPEGDAHILRATLKAIDGASESIDIENAYFISTPDIRQALLDALSRGVKVRLLTNSSESVDEPIVSAPILSSLPELIQAGAEVYLKQGDTLHSKFMVVDGLFSSVGSYNLHPRSQRYEGEMNLNILDAGTANELIRAFENDLQQARRVASAESIQVPQNLLTTLASRYFFDQL